MSSTLSRMIWTLLSTLLIAETCCAIIALFVGNSALNVELAELYALTSNI